MIEDIRRRYNDSFTPEKYHNFLEDLNVSAGWQVSFRVAESPVFIGHDLGIKLKDAAREITEFLATDEFTRISRAAVPAELVVPNETRHTNFLALDFAVTRGADNELHPKLIELQGFPSLFGWQDFLAEKFRQHFAIPSDYYNHFVEQATYCSMLRDVILADEDPVEVILLEIDPFRQNTAVDFVLTEKIAGIKSVHLGDVKREGRKLYYTNNGRKTQVKRIYNRVIFDELQQRKDLDLTFHLTEDVDVSWAGHPNWFFRISKYIMPYLRNEFVPECRFLSDYEIFPSDLENYVLKPLYSFSGSGIVFNLTSEHLAAISPERYEAYILQRKVQYEPVVRAPDGNVKVEIRLMFVWDDQKASPTLLTNLCRLSRGEMIGVKYNKDKTWVGGSVCFFEP